MDGSSVDFTSGEADEKDAARDTGQGWVVATDAFTALQTGSDMRMSSQKRLEELDWVTGLLKPHARTAEGHRYGSAYIKDTFGQTVKAGWDRTKNMFPGGKPWIGTKESEEVFWGIMAPVIRNTPFTGGLYGMAHLLPGYESAGGKRVTGRGLTTPLNPFQQDIMNRAGAAGPMPWHPDTHEFQTDDVDYRIGEEYAWHTPFRSQISMAGVWHNAAKVARHVPGAMDMAKKLPEKTQRALKWMSENALEKIPNLSQALANMNAWVGTNITGEYVKAQKDIQVANESTDLLRRVTQAVNDPDFAQEMMSQKRKQKDIAQELADLIKTGDMSDIRLKGEDIIQDIEWNKANIDKKPLVNPPVTVPASQQSDAWKAKKYLEDYKASKTLPNNQGTVGRTRLRGFAPGDARKGKGWAPTWEWFKSIDAKSRKTWTEISGRLSKANWIKTLAREFDDVNKLGVVRKGAKFVDAAASIPAEVMGNLVWNYSPTGDESLESKEAWAYVLQENPGLIDWLGPLTASSEQYQYQGRGAMERREEMFDNVSQEAKEAGDKIAQEALKEAKRNIATQGT